MTDLHIDIETRSEVDLLKRGAYVYAADPSTEVLCICYAFDDGPVLDWACTDGDIPQSLPDDLRLALADPAVKLWAHNAAFERLLFEHKIQPDIGVERWHCTAVLCRAYALPSALGDAAKCMRLPIGKIDAGKDLIKRMSIPPYEFTPELLDDMVDYCVGDVEVERAIHAMLPDIGATAWRDYHVAERINDRGLRIDTAFAAVASTKHDAERLRIKRAFGELSGFTSPASRTWTMVLYDQVSALAEEDPNYVNLPGIMHKYDKGQLKISLDSSRVDMLLAEPLPLDIRELLEMKQLYARTSATKFATMLQRVSDDDRARGVYVYKGAAKTGRFSSRGLQMHNSPRDTVQNILDPERKEDKTLDKFNPVHVMDTAVVTGDVDISVLPALIRPAVYPEDGNVFVCGDWTSVEAIALPWLASTRPGKGLREYLEVFERGEDIYLKDGMDYLPKGLRDRQISKVATLSLGYGGGIGAFQAMARGYKVKISDSDAEQVKVAWREKNGWAPAFWRVLNNAAVEAMKYEGQIFAAGRVAYVKEGSNLYCILPSGRRLCYLDAGMEPPKKHWQQPYISAIKGSMKPKAGVGVWPREALWGGFLAENVTQAVCADLMTELLNLMETSNAAPAGEWRTVGHTHDECLLEVDDYMVEDAVIALRSAMTMPPEWGVGLPLSADIWTGYYYRKA